LHQKCPVFDEVRKPGIIPTGFNSPARVRKKTDFIDVFSFQASVFESGLKLA